jgi:thiamine monophosphate kinase
MRAHASWPAATTTSSVPRTELARQRQITDVLNIPLTRIGQIKRGKGVSLQAEGKPVKVDGLGYDHFSGS